MPEQEKFIDMIVNLYNVPDSRNVCEALLKRGVMVRLCRAYEKRAVCSWVAQHFSAPWASEVDVAFAREPIACFIATKERHIIGFACIESTAKGFYGPTGVLKSVQGQGIGKALLLRCMESLRQRGYAYGIIGGVGPRAFYEKVVDARAIENCHVQATGETSVYQDMFL